MDKEFSIDTVTQGSTEWLEMRKNYIGASDAPILMGVNKFKLNDGRVKTPYLLWEEKIGIFSGDSNNAATQYGHKMEPVARREYEQMSGFLVSPAIVTHSSVPFMMASLDGINIDKTRAVEIKNCNADDHKEAVMGVVPAHYYPQVQHQLACLGHDEMDYFSYHKGEGVIVTVKRDEEYINKLIEVEKQFWDCVVNIKPPKKTKNDYTQKYEEWVKYAEGLFLIKQKISELKQQEKLYEKTLHTLSNGENCVGGDYLFSMYSRKGNIDYANIPELKGVDLEKYRKEPISYWKVTKKYF